MPESTEATKVAAEAQTQPWRAVWPAPESAARPQLERKARSGGSGSGAFGYNDKNEGIAGKKVV